MNDREKERQKMKDRNIGRKGIRPVCAPVI